MAEFLSQRLIGRLAALLFALSGGVTMITLVLPGDSSWNRIGMCLIALTAVGIGVVAWYLPWHRWPRWAPLPLVPLAFCLIAAGQLVKQDPWSYAVYYVVAFVWLGVAQPQGTSLRVGPIAAAFYVSPFVITRPGLDAVSSVAVVIPVCLLVGESLAWISGRLRHAERLDLRRMGDMESLLHATVALARQDDAKGAANLAALLAVRLLRADAAIVLLAQTPDHLVGTGGWSWAGDPRSVEVDTIDEPAREAMTTGEVAVHAGGVVGQLTGAGDGRPALFLPLLGQVGPLGVLMVVFPDGTDLEVDGFTSGLARTFATQSGLAFERLRATQVLLDASLRDALTGVGNRRQADNLLTQLKPDDGVAIIDCDHFKDVNDRLGHAAGDAVLIELARFLDRCLRDGDAVARFGGEEFIVVLRHVGPNGRAAVDRLLRGWRATEPITTFSAGVALHVAGARPQDTLAQADRALYRAKQAGRNRVMDAADTTPDDVVVLG